MRRLTSTEGHCSPLETQTARIFGAILESRTHMIRVRVSDRRLDD